MKIGVGSYAYRWSIGIGETQPPSPLQPLELLERVAALGAQVLQLGDNMPLHRVAEAELRQLATSAGALGVELEVGMHGTDADDLRRYLDIAVSLDARVVRASLTREDLTGDRADLLRRLTSAAKEFFDSNRLIALENHFLIDSPALAALVSDLAHPAIGVCMDVANSIATGEWPEETVDILAPHAVNVHIKDYRFEIDAHGAGIHVVGTPMGTGHIDIARVLCKIHELERDMNVIVEHWIPKNLADGAANVNELEDTWTKKGLDVVKAHAYESTPRPEESYDDRRK